MKKYVGFTLIELLVSVAIIGILISIAYPSYVRTVMKSNRAEAKSELTDAAQRLQRCYTAYGAFNNSACTIYNQVTATYLSRGNAYYRIAFSSSPTVSATVYKLQATAVKAPQTRDTTNSCNVLMVDQDGTRTPAVCWQ